MFGPKICGPKLAHCCLITSVWGIIMLILVGIFIKDKSVALEEDMPKKNGEYQFSSVSTYCFAAAGIYAATLVISIWQKKVNESRSYEVHH